MSGGLGIDLVPEGSDPGPTANDADNPNTTQVDPDSDIGANDLQNKPVLGSARTVSGKAMIKGKLLSTPAKTFTVEFYANPAGAMRARSRWERRV